MTARTNATMSYLYARQTCGKCLGFMKIEEIINIYEDKTVKDFNQYMPKMLVWLTKLVRERYNHGIVGSG